ncbi:type IV pilin protein [uncultured Endozoicomonas sp.]|uniref:type IV pilin protein n=1 Tax=uncultured Endozoicomonas sp. TaxID=432652 RepID=UPI0026206753|nr:type IV pilin protein [uncultured Endozoicomonas sp.]
MKPSQSGSNRSQKGYTLGELMIVLVIIGILSSIVYPSYSQYMFETRRSDAWVALTNAAAAQERWYSVNFRFTDAVVNLGGGSSPEGFYAISVESSSTSYRITATAIDTKVQASDTGCTVITLDHLGIQSPNDCWK